MLSVRILLGPTRLAPIRCVSGCSNSTRWARIIRTMWKLEIELLNHVAVLLKKHSMFRVICVLTSPYCWRWFHQVEVAIVSNLPSLTSKSKYFTAAASVALPSRPLCTRYLQMTRLPSGKVPISFARIILFSRRCERIVLLRVFSGRKAALPTFQ